MTHTALTTYIALFGGGTLALAAIVLMMQHLRIAPQKPERVL